MTDLARGSIHEVLRAAVPEFGPAIDEHASEFDGEVIEHLLFGDLTRFVLSARAEGSAGLVARCLAFLDLALREGDLFVQELVAVSFVENVEPWSRDGKRFIKTWPAALKAEAKRQAEWKPDRA